MSLRVLVVDDEPLARRKLRRFLEAEPGIAWAGEAGDGERAVSRLEEGGVDAVFLDVAMPGLDGFDVVEAVGAEAMPVVVFVTAHDEHALRAFEARAIDYLLKPYDRDRFRRALARVRLLAAAPRPGAAAGDALRDAVRAARPRGTGRFLVREGSGIHVVPERSVAWIEAQGNYAALHVGPACRLVRETMASLDARLDPSSFVRVSRAAIVARAHVAALNPWTREATAVVLRSGTVVPVSRRFRARVEAAFRRP